MESALNVEHFEKLMSFITQTFLQLLTPKHVFTYMDKRSFSWKLFGSERANESRKLLKYAKKYFYATFSSVWLNLR